MAAVGAGTGREYRTYVRSSRGEVSTRKTGRSHTHPVPWRVMARHRRRHLHPDPDERFSLPSDTDPEDVLRRLLGTPGPVQSHEDAEDPNRDRDETPDDS
jgi:hypothetical protein